MRYSLHGRPRQVSDADIAEILRWHAMHETKRALARRLGLSTSTVSAVIRTQGRHYKSPSPERRAAAKAAGELER